MASHNRRTAENEIIPEVTVVGVPPGSPGQWVTLQPRVRRLHPEHQIIQQPQPFLQPQRPTTPPKTPSPSPLPPVAKPKRRVTLKTSPVRSTSPPPHHEHLPESQFKSNHRTPTARKSKSPSNSLPNSSQRSNKLKSVDTESQTNPFYSYSDPPRSPPKHAQPPSLPLPNGPSLRSPVPPVYQHQLHPQYMINYPPALIQPYPPPQGRHFLSSVGPRLQSEYFFPGLNPPLVPHAAHPAVMYPQFAPSIHPFSHGQQILTQPGVPQPPFQALRTPLPPPVYRPPQYRNHATDQYPILPPKSPHSKQLGSLQENVIPEERGPLQASETSLRMTNQRWSAAEQVPGITFEALGIPDRGQRMKEEAAGLFPERSNEK